jgi:hypothetical protein
LPLLRFETGTPAFFPFVGLLSKFEPLVMD